MTALATRSPYLRNRLLQAAAGLRDDAETARLNLAEADQDVAAARALLAEAEAHRDRARAEVDSITHDITWLEEQADRHTAEPDDDPAAKLRKTGLMRHEPKQIDPQQRRELLRELTHEAVEAGSYGEPAQVADLRKPSDQPEHTGSGGSDDLPFNVVQAPADVVAALTGSHPTIAPDAPDEPAGVVVATHGPTTTAPIDPAVTTPDAGLAHPVPNPAVLPPADPTTPARHAKPRGSRLTGGFKALITKPEQDGDQQ